MRAHRFIMLAAASRIFALGAVMLALAACGPDASPEAARPQTQGAVQADGAQAQRPSFIVRFRPDHPMGEAQALEAAGQCEAARALAERTLRDRRELSGLCFNRFTAGGAEIVLDVCASAADSEDWLARLRAMEDVEYADGNMIVQIDDCNTGAAARTGAQKGL
ncbi:MAG: hypothetical protein AB7O04_11405 [Hyphomonadaceae bacterium]